MVLIQDVLLFAYGLVPQYAGVAIVEKYYTAWWTAFWNVFGLSVIALDFAFGTADILNSVILAFIGIVLAALIYFSLGSMRPRGYSYFLRNASQTVTRKLGMSGSSVVVSWMLIGLYAGGFDPGFFLLSTLIGAVSVVLVWASVRVTW